MRDPGGAPNTVVLVRIVLSVSVYLPSATSGKTLVTPKVAEKPLGPFSVIGVAGSGNPSTATTIVPVVGFVGPS